MDNRFLKGSVAKKLLSVFLVLFGLFVLVAIAGGIAQVHTGDTSLTLASTVRRLMKGEPIIQRTISEPAIVRASNDNGNVELRNPNNSNLSLASIEKSLWPKDAAGGIYELTPNGEFEKGVNFRMTLLETPTDDFSLGYWYPETKKWEWLPTVKISDKTFETVLPHATQIGGGSGGSCSTPPKNAENISMTNEIAAQLRQMEGEQQTGNADEGNEADWKKTWEMAKELADKAINDFCQKKDVISQHDFYAAWELMQCLGFQSLNERFVNTWENKCEEKEKIEQYEINQTEEYKASINIDLGPAYKLDYRDKTMLYYNGTKSGTAKQGKPAWRGEWRVYQSANSNSISNQTGHMESEDDEYRAEWDLRALNIAGTSTDLQMLIFSLDNVKEGESFPVTAVRAGDYYARSSGPDATMRIRSTHKATGMVVRDQKQSASAVSSMSIPPGHKLMLTAFLQKDLGEAGALISFSSKINFTPEQAKQIEAMNKLQQESGSQVMKDIWTPSGNSNLVKMESDAKPLRIYRTGQAPKENEEDDWKSAQADLEASRKKSNSQQKNSNTDQNGDELPELAPMPSEGDANGDGIPDIVPIPN